MARFSTFGETKAALARAERRGIKLGGNRGAWLTAKARAPGRASAISRLYADRHLAWSRMSDSRHKLRNARPIVATSRETKTFAVKYA